MVARRVTNSLAQLGKGRSRRWSVFCTPRDSLLTSLDLPPLPAAKTAAAVACAAQALILGPVEQMHVAHSPRDSDGHVQVAWVPTAGLERLGQLLAQAAETARSVPGALCLAAWAASLRCRTVICCCATACNKRAVHPLGRTGCLRSAAAEVPTAWPRRSAGAGAVPGWGLHGAPQPEPASGGWGRALGCCRAGRWPFGSLGLNLYAARQAGRGPAAQSADEPAGEARHFPNCR